MYIQAEYKLAPWCWGSGRVSDGVPGSWCLVGGKESEEGESSQSTGSGREMGAGVLGWDAIKGRKGGFLRWDAVGVDVGCGCNSAKLGLGEWHGVGQRGRYDRN